MKGLHTILTAILIVSILSFIGAGSYPQLTGYVTDNANIIDNEYELKITQLAENINKNTTVEIAVLTIPSLEGEEISQYAVNVGRQAGVGKKDVSNGLLILIALEDREYFVATGYRLEGTLPDATVDKINRDILVPNLKRAKETGDIKYYGQGIYEEMLVFEGFLTNNTEVISKYGTSGSKDDINIAIIFGIILIFFVVLTLISIIGGSRDSGYSRGGYGGGWGGGSGSGSRGSGGGNGGGNGGSFGGGGFGGGGAGGSFKKVAGTGAAVAGTGAAGAGATIGTNTTKDEDNNEDNEEEKLKKKRKKKREQEDSYSTYNYSNYNKSSNSSSGFGGFGGGGFGGGGAGGKW